MIGERIKKLREEAGISQLELSKEIRIAQSSIGNYERGDRLPDADVIQKIAIYFDVSCDYLLGIIEKKKHEFVSISNELGLSEAAIARIRLLRTSIDGINEIIESRVFPYIVDYLLRYANYTPDKYEEYLDFFLNQVDEKQRDEFFLYLKKNQPGIMYAYEMSSALREIAEVYREKVQANLVLNNKKED